MTNSMQHVHVMLDLETWGLTPGSDIRSIGAVVFDPVARTLGAQFYLNTSGGKEFGLTRDSSTVQWWSQQSEEAQSAFALNRVPLDTALWQFGEFWREVELGTLGARLWAHGPHFDEAILAACYRATDLPVPWHYRAPRDCRTIWDAAGGVDLPFEGTEHNALDDAKHQARCVIEAYRKLGRSIARDATAAIYLPPDADRLLAEWQASAPEGDRENPFAWAARQQDVL